jgi:hypothetical protein
MNAKAAAPGQPAKKKPPNAGKGRKQGVPNKTTMLLKVAIIEAAAAVGENGKGKGKLKGYCKWLAVQEPKAFASLLGRVLPTQIEVDPDSAGNVIFQTVYEAAAPGN